MALDLFPQFESDLRSSRVGYTIYSLFADLRVEAERAHARGDNEELNKIYGFAEWCSRQPAEVLWNAAGVSFYEHLFEDQAQGTIVRVVPWLSAYVIRKHWDLWRVWYEERWDELRPHLEKRLEEAVDDPGESVSWEWGE